jgi:aerobic-type carbon monoxide dehydrogenase small subunit (CoxS/CutS family)
MKLNINNIDYEITADPEMPLLWALRDILGLTGTKYGCGIGICGTCVVIADGEAIRSCLNPLASVAGKKIITIEGLSDDNSHPLQRAWIKTHTSQCGYCVPGQIMSAAALLIHKPKPTDEDIDAAMNDNICRCGTYSRIKDAIKLAMED